VHPGLEPFIFPGDHPQQIVQLLHRLRDAFGKSVISEEDTLRTSSLRRSSPSTEDPSGATGLPEAFLQQSQPEIDFSYAKTPVDPRAFELITKTNQFNLNGRRYTSAEWQQYSASPDTFVLVASYRDKYGPLGKIAVLAGTRADRHLSVDTWVMSCRAFGRRIESACLGALFDTFDVSEIEFDFVATERNGPMKTFLEDITGGPAVSRVRLSRPLFEERRPVRYHQMTVVANHG
jgi:FkbH-like protein